MAPRGEGIGPGSLNLFLALLRHSWHWMVLLGPWSVNQRQGVALSNLCSRAAGPWTGPPHFRASRLGPWAFSISGINSFECNFVRLCVFIQANPCHHSRWVAPVIGRVKLGCSSNLMRVRVCLTSPIGLPTFIYGQTRLKWTDQRSKFYETPSNARDA
jgi:hypothetical protein